MRELFLDKDILLIAKALDSELRLKMIRLLMENGQMNLNDLAAALGVTNGAITAHIRLLENAGVVSIKNISARRGSQKLCQLNETSFLLETAKKSSAENCYETEIPIGTFSRYEAHPTCGLATKDQLIGQVDDPRYFDDPQRISASIVWLFTGYLEYRIPNYLKAAQKPTEIQISLELSSEAPGTCEEWPSDINFSINNISIGLWTSPGDFGSHKGLYTPDWWPNEYNQYGLLKIISVSERGTFVDGIQISSTTMSNIGLDYKSDIIFRLSVPDEGRHVGGLTLFGKHFGNYRQDIKVRILYQS